jgi:hypothetical protein
MVKVDGSNTATSLDEIINNPSWACGPEIKARGSISLPLENPGLGGTVVFSVHSAVSLTRRELQPQQFTRGDSHNPQRAGLSVRAREVRRVLEELVPHNRAATGKSKFLGNRCRAALFDRPVRVESRHRTVRVIHEGHDPPIASRESRYPPLRIVGIILSFPVRIHGNGESSVVIVTRTIRN